MNYSSDIRYDFWWAALWGVSTIVNATNMSGKPPRVAVPSLVFSLAMFLLYVATGVMSVKVRSAIAAAEARRDVEAGAPAPVVGFVATDVYSGATVGGVPVRASADAVVKPIVSAPVPVAAAKV